MSLAVQARTDASANGAVGQAGEQAHAAVEIRGLVKRYAGRAVVDGLDLTIRRGEIFAILGPNGAGKTTTVETLEGYRRPDGGQARVLGLDPLRDARQLRARIGVMLQGGGLYPQARPLETLRLFARFYLDPRNPDELLDLVGLRDVAGTRFKVLSGGQRQRLGLALALVGRPELVILDEPTAGMDPAAKAATRQLIADLRTDGVTVLLTTHELADVERLADRIAIIDRGRLVALGSPAELTTGARPAIRFRVARPLDDAARDGLVRTLESAAGEMATETGAANGAAPTAATGIATAASVSIADGERPGAYRVDGVDPDPAAVARLADWCARRSILLLEVRTEGGTLEERYLELTGETAEAHGAAAGPAAGAIGARA